MDQLVQFLKNLGTGRLVMVIGVGALTFLFFSFIVGQLNTAPMEILFADLEPSDSAQIVQSLEAQGVAYELAAGGRSISVPSNQVDRLRLALAGEGLTGGVIGKEIFDQEASFGRTSFELNVNFVRAIEGELSRTITSLNAVNEARVHLVMPERRPFQRELSQPSASILVRVRGGGLANEQVRAVQSLVASAVPGLTLDRVTVTDTTGRLLSDGNKTGAYGALGALEETRLAMENQLRQKIEGLLARSVGAENVRADVALQLSASRSTQNQITFDPEGQVARASETTETESTDTDGSGRVTIGDTQPDAGTAPGGGDTSSESSTQEIINFDNSKTEVITTTEPGQIEMLRVAVMINEAAVPGLAGVTDAGQREQLLTPYETIVRSAVPYDIDRDGTDAIQVVSMQFVAPPDLEPVEEEFNLVGLDTGDIIQIVQPIALTVVAGLFIMLIVRPIVMRVIEAIPDAPAPGDPAQLENDGAETPAITGPDGSVTVTPELIAQAASGDEKAAQLVNMARTAGGLDLATAATDTKIAVAQIEGKVQDSAIKQVADIIKSNPDDSVAIVRSWMYAD